MPKWKKIGKIFEPSKEKFWLSSHASVPIAEKIEKDHLRIYFSSRDQYQRSYTGYLVININRPNEILEISEKPILEPGNLGEFDDSGAMASWITEEENNCRFLYYIGWNLSVTVPFRNSIGLAISKNNGPFIKYSKGPILDRSAQEPHFCASSCVIKEKNSWKMWYLSCTGWEIYSNKPRHNYHIKYAESDDGINWVRNSYIAINYKDDNEYAISRPSVVKDQDIWRMWFSCRGTKYKIGYAESIDGKDWIRKDTNAGIDVSESGWDSEMIEYPFVFDNEGSRYMLYNGNQYGKTGFGIAVFE
tara:strand:+ start:482 stop:1390 length:909 start_codon:yes stop_codon:yes gene_type:complete